MFQVAHWNKEMNRKKATIDWRFTSKEARRKFKYTVKTNISED